jgi:hypothetical protein
MSGGPTQQPTVVVSRPELKAGVPQNYDGNIDDAERWMYSVETYFLINSTIYNSDQTKVAVALQYMNDGDARVWADTFYRAAFDKPAVDFGSWKDFKKAFTESFHPVDRMTEALTKLHGLSQTGDVMPYIATFKTLSSTASLKQDVALIHFFERGLKPGLRTAIYGKEVVPTTIDKWYTAATQLEANYKRSRAVVPNNRSVRPSGHRHVPKPQVRQRDPDAMDVDRSLTPEERQKCFDKGLCFKCKEKGHRANDSRFHPKVRRGDKNDEEDKGKKPSKSGVRQLDESSDEEDMEVNLVKRKDF